jgi:hypothetical protein
MGTPNSKRTPRKSDTDEKIELTPSTNEFQSGRKKPARLICKWGAVIFQQRGVTGFAFRNSLILKGTFLVVCEKYEPKWVVQREKREQGPAPQLESYTGLVTPRESRKLQ